MYEPIYNYLLNARTADKVAEFIKREPPLRSYVKELEKLRSMTRSISSLYIHVSMHLFLLDCEELNQVSIEALFFLVHSFQGRAQHFCFFTLFNAIAVTSSFQRNRAQNS